jgi:hypothetical protein
MFTYNRIRTTNLAPTTSNGPELGGGDVASTDCHVATERVKPDFAALAVAVEKKRKEMN